MRRLWDLDINRLVPEKDYDLDLQQGKSMHDKRDAASKPLFVFVDEHALERPTYKAFMSLFDNYVESIGVQESNRHPRRTSGKHSVPQSHHGYSRHEIRTCLLSSHWKDEKHDSRIVHPRIKRQMV